MGKGCVEDKKEKKPERGRMYGLLVICAYERIFGNLNEEILK